MTKLHSFSPKVVHYLKDAGWRPGRQVKTTHWESLLRNMNNPIYPAISEFLHEFGGLTVTHPHTKDLDCHEPDFFCLSPSIADTEMYIDDEAIAKYVEWAGVPLCTIGTACRHYVRLLMAEDGCVYGAMDDYLWYLGSSGPEAIEVISTASDWKQIGPREPRT